MACELLPCASGYLHPSRDHGYRQATACGVGLIPPVIASVHRGVAHEPLRELSQRGDEEQDGESVRLRGLAQTQAYAKAGSLQVPEGCLNLHPFPLTGNQLVSAIAREALGDGQQPGFSMTPGLLAAGREPNRVP